MHPSSLQLLLLLALLVIASTSPPPKRSYAGMLKCKPIESNPPSNAFCQRPPAVPVDLSVYKGLWYNIYNTGVAVLISGSLCTTANYTQSEGGLDVLNCRNENPVQKPTCVRGIATARAGENTRGSYDLNFPGVPRTGDYHVAAVVGSASSGYIAAAVYACVRVPGAPNLPQFFIIARSTRFPWLSLLLLKFKLRCRGYDTQVSFVGVDHGRKCNYFFQEGGFRVIIPTPPPLPNFVPPN